MRGARLGAGDADRDDHARPHGRRRHLRPSGRRVRALLAPTRRGTCRTSRRCSTTTRSSRGCTRARGRSRATTGTGASATETLDYLLREMQHAEGGFFSSQDADSEGVEGKFFVWTWDELVALVGPAVATCFGATPEGNWEGTNVLWRPRAVADVAAEHGLPADELAAEVGGRPATLFEVREARVRPATDDKVLTAWNALAIGALAEAGRVFGEPSYVQAAVRCAEFVLTHLRDDRGRLLRSWRDGTAGRPGFADDYAVMAAACLTLYETTFELRWFEEARDARRRAAPPVPRRRARRLLPDGLRRRGAGPSAEGALRQRRRRPGTRSRPRCCCGWRCSPATRGTSDAGLSALRLIRDAMAGAPDRVRPGALRAGPLPRARRTRSRSSATPRRPTRARWRRRSRAPPIARTSCWPSPRPMTQRAALTGPAAARPGGKRRTRDRLRLRAVHVQAPRDRRRRAPRTARR